MTDGQVCCGCVVVHPDGDVELTLALLTGDVEDERTAVSKVVRCLVA